MEWEKETVKWLEKNLDIKAMERRAIANFTKESYYLAEEGYAIETIISTLKDSSAGSFLVKEVLEEITGIDIDEEEYRENFGEYVDILENCVDTANNWLEEKNNSKEIRFDLGYSEVGDLVFRAQADYDYVPEIFKKNLLAHTEETIALSLYSQESLWKLNHRTEDSAYLLILSNYNEDRDKIDYLFFTFYSIKELIQVANKGGTSSHLQFMLEEHSELLNEEKIREKKLTASDYETLLILMTDTILNADDFMDCVKEAKIPLEILNKNFVKEKYKISEIKEPLTIYKQ